MSGHRVLIVEDDSDIRDSLIDYLEDHGYEAIGAVHGRDALDKLERTDKRPCVIVLDLMMPVMDGEAFREQQLQNPDLSKIPVVVISAYRDLEERSKSLRVMQHLNKPLDLRQLLSLVRAHCT